MRDIQSFRQSSGQKRSHLIHPSNSKTRFHLADRAFAHGDTSSLRDGLIESLQLGDFIGTVMVFVSRGGQPEGAMNLSS
ncbi:hypothetical protein [Pajaroellobacter abortibovis]|uniref:hypothetical protein n=1 Tax=Pajaroellobacter abortibovis TaxID=1882918 RepID=UPI0012EC5BF6|nr:hypothetical protein [Pajaroellobacter abortibovis]